PCGAGPRNQGGRPPSTARGCHGKNSNICSQTCHRVCQKGRKSLENQGPKMTDPTQNDSGLPQKCRRQARSSTCAVDRSHLAPLATKGFFGKCRKPGRCSPSPMTPRWLAW